MNIVVLLSQGIHPVSGRPCPVPVELQAIALGLGLLGQSAGAALTGLYAGPAHDALRDYGGHGLDRILHLRLTETADPVPALCEAISAQPPDLLLAGNRGQGGEDSGLLPYRLADALGRPLCAGAVALMRSARGMSAVLALPKGVRRQVAFSLPALVTVHPLAPPAHPFAFARARRTDIVERPAASAPAVTPPVETRPYRPRPKYLAAANTDTKTARLLIDPDPDAAASAILEALSAIGARSPR